MTSSPKSIATKRPSIWAVSVASAGLMLALFALLLAGPSAHAQTLTSPQVAAAPCVTDYTGATVPGCTTTTVAATTATTAAAGIGTGGGIGTGTPTSGTGTLATTGSNVVKGLALALMAIVAGATLNTLSRWRRSVR